MTRWEKLRWAAVGVLGRRLLAAWTGSCRIKTLGREGYEKARQDGQPVIFLIWHGRILIVPYLFRGRGVAALVSPSRDGEFLARIGTRWNYRTIRGSSSHSMVRAWVEMMDALRHGGELIIVPDGPRGPARTLKSGALKLARDTGALLVPFSFSASKKRFLGSWDRFLLFYPFSRIVAVYGEPVGIPPDTGDETLEILRGKIEQTLVALDAQADACFEERGASPPGWNR
jgi:lysophospholipid acyltransferase (LPLAT)-like uncharacterized protein